MTKKTKTSRAFLLTCCAVGVLLASNQSWAATIDNCAQVSGVVEDDIDSTKNNKPTFQDIFDAVYGDPVTKEDDEACARFTVLSVYDYGDAPDSYGTLEASGGAKHEIIPGLSLGAIVDDEDGTLTNADANADDNNGESDEDGYMVTTLTEGEDPDWTVSVINDTGSSANLVCWVDYDGNGLFATDGTESGSATVASATGTQTITLNMPEIPDTAVDDNLDAGTGKSESYARCRLSTDPTLDASTPAGAMIDGEVEDRKITFVDKPVFDLALRKKLTEPALTIQAGDTVSFNIEVINQGNMDATGVVVTDYIPDEMELDASETNWTVDAVDPNLVRLTTPVSVESNGIAVLTIKLKVKDGQTAGNITNTAEISTALDVNGDAVDDDDSIPDDKNDNDGAVDDDEIDNAGGDEDDHDIAILSVSPTVDVDLVKAVFEADGITAANSVRRGDTLIYVLTVTNSGPDDATTVTVTDKLPTGLTYVTDDTSGTAYDSASGLWTIGDLANGASVSLRIEVTVD
uniref:Conserved repeat domain-containing protein n=1 Tax=uncultured Thiotrichaceae bacterium TaxID=298394 RepID=A0A6S6TDF0_9GAMM|nr:MAG: Conserved repeat domain-containing protein [uncultured Thiotrichaceae bacterium]